LISRHTSTEHEAGEPEREYGAGAPERITQAVVATRNGVTTRNGSNLLLLTLMAMLGVKRGGIARRIFLPVDYH
jgi:hypothetical protein